MSNDDDNDTVGSATTSKLQNKRKAEQIELTDEGVVPNDEDVNNTKPAVVLAKRVRRVIIPSHGQQETLRATNDMILKLRRKEDLLVSIILSKSGTESRIVTERLGRFVVDTMREYNLHAQRKIAEADKRRGGKVAVSNFHDRKLPDAEIKSVENMFALINKNNANDHVSRIIRLTAIFLGLTISYEFRSEFTTPSTHVKRFADAAETAFDANEQKVLDEMRSQRIDRVTLERYLEMYASDYKSLLFDGVIAMPTFAQKSGESYLALKPLFNSWISRQYHINNRNI